MQAPTHKQIELYLKIGIALASAGLIVLCFLLVREYRHVRQLDYVAAHGSLFEALRAKGPIGASDASSTQAWMTFDYINHLFALPPQYLETALAITDSRYPRLTIQEYAEDAHLDRTAFLAQAQGAIRTYFSNKQ